MEQPWSYVRIHDGYAGDLFGTAREDDTENAIWPQAVLNGRNSPFGAAPGLDSMRVYSAAIETRSERKRVNGRKHSVIRQKRAYVRQEKRLN